VNVIVTVAALVLVDLPAKTVAVSLFVEPAKGPAMTDQVALVLEAPVAVMVLLPLTITSTRIRLPIAVGVREKVVAVPVIADPAAVQVIVC
jgi:hypothetical protein